MLFFFLLFVCYFYFGNYYNIFLNTLPYQIKSSYSEKNLKIKSHDFRKKCLEKEFKKAFLGTVWFITRIWSVYRHCIDSVYALCKDFFKRLMWEGSGKGRASHTKTWTWLRQGNFKRETESLQISAQNNAVRINHIKARIDKTQQNSKCRLCKDKDETINHIISECIKLAQKEDKTRHDKEFHRDMCKKLKFDHTNKWHIHNPASVQENNTHKLLWVFDTETDHLISTRRPDLIKIDKKKRVCKIIDFAVPADHRIKLKVWKEG